MRMAATANSSGAYCVSTGPHPGNAAVGVLAVPGLLPDTEAPTVSRSAGHSENVIAEPLAAVPITPTAPAATLSLAWSWSSGPSSPRRRA